MIQFVTPANRIFSASETFGAFCVLFLLAKKKKKKQATETQDKLKDPVCKILNGIYGSPVVM